MIRTLGLIAMIAGVLVVVVFQYTDPIIKENERIALESAVFRVIPGVDQQSATRVSFALDANGLVRLDENTASAANLFVVYNKVKELAGIALQGAAQGYQDVVHTLYGYDPGCECIVGLTVVKSTDTPGMGDKHTVEANAEFMANFKGLSAKLTADKRTVAHPIETVKHGTKTDAWQVDAMSGATISSRAIGNGLRESTGQLLPLIARHLPEIEVLK
jgi:electron transport complex protein RnfG